MTGVKNLTDPLDPSFDSWYFAPIVLVMMLLNAVEKKCNMIEHETESKRSSKLPTPTMEFRMIVLIPYLVKYTLPRFVVLYLKSILILKLVKCLSKPRMDRIKLKS